MKILVISNLYPPHFIGGYELGCKDVVEGLRARGHTVRVLTSTFCQAANAPETEPDVERSLHYDPAAVGGWSRHLIECRKLKSELQQFAPDLVYCWNQVGLSPWLSIAARWHGYRTAYFLSDNSFTAWRVGAWLEKVAARSPWIRSLFGATFLMKGRPVIQGQTCHFCSEFLRKTAVESGIVFNDEKSIVAHWGIDPGRFTAPDLSRPRWPVRRLLYAGQISPIKGIHTAILAMADLRKAGLNDLHLTIVGGATDAAYEEKLRASAVALGLSEHVEFRGKVARAQLTDIYAETDLLLFPSEWDEPFAITPLEAMASGLLVVGTTTGGSGELLRNRDTALTFRAGDSGDCARAICEACEDQALFENVRLKGQREVLQKHTLEAMIDRLEKNLQTLL